MIPGEACRNHGDVTAKWRCSKCAQQFCDGCILEGRQFGVPGVKFCPSCKSHAQKIGAVPAGGKNSSDKMTFAGEMLAAWKYPFRSEGPIIMLAGAIFFTLAAFGQRFLLLLAIPLSILIMGYWMAYTQKVISASAQGDEDPPTWPDLSNFLEDILVPFFQAVGMYALYLLPFWLATVFLPEDEMRTDVIRGGLLLVGLFMMPMAWLAVSLHGSIVGLSPHFVIPSILRIPGQYVVIFLEVVVLVAINVGLKIALREPAIPFVSALVSSFLGVYFAIVICRLLGSLYYLNRTTLGWFRVR